MTDDCEVVWDGSVNGPNRGLLCLSTSPTRPAPWMPDEPTHRPGKGRNSREWTIHRLQHVMGSGDWTVVDLATEAEVSITAVERAVRRCVKDGRVREVGRIPQQAWRKGPTPMRYQWAA